MIHLSEGRNQGHVIEKEQEKQEPHKQASSPKKQVQKCRDEESVTNEIHHIFPIKVPKVSRAPQRHKVLFRIQEVLKIGHLRIGTKHANGDEKQEKMKHLHQTVEVFCLSEIVRLHKTLPKNDRSVPKTISYPIHRKKD
jgi:hypothetical protein